MACYRHRHAVSIKNKYSLIYLPTLPGRLMQTQARFVLFVRYIDRLGELNECNR